MGRRPGVLDGCDLLFAEFNFFALAFNGLKEFFFFGRAVRLCLFREEFVLALDAAEFLEVFAEVFDFVNEFSVDLHHFLVFLLVFFSDFAEVVAEGVN